MGLRDTVFFPQSILPIYIHEPRYRAMLRDVLSGDRIFAIARTNNREPLNPFSGEPTYTMATAGMVRASHANPDGTSNLVLQGLCRVRLRRVVSESPYRQAEVAPEGTPSPENPSEVDSLRRRVAHLLGRERELASDVPEEFLQFLQTIDDPDAFLDLTAYSTCSCPDLKQELLETLDLEARYHVFLHYLHRRVERHQFFRRLQGQLAEESISLN